MKDFFNHDLNKLIKDFQEEFPGWWFTMGICALTGHASIGPDYNDPVHAERLTKEFPMEEWDGVINVDIASGSVNNMSYAFYMCIAKARVMKDENNELD